MFEVQESADGNLMGYGRSPSLLPRQGRALADLLVSSDGQSRGRGTRLAVRSIKLIGYKAGLGWG